MMYVQQQLFMVQIQSANRTASMIMKGQMEDKETWIRIPHNLRQDLSTKERPPYSQHRAPCLA